MNISRVPNIKAETMLCVNTKLCFAFVNMSRIAILISHIELKNLLPYHRMWSQRFFLVTYQDPSLRKSNVKHTTCFFIILIVHRVSLRSSNISHTNWRTASLISNWEMNFNMISLIWTLSVVMSDIFFGYFSRSSCSVITNHMRSINNALKLLSQNESYCIIAFLGSSPFIRKNHELGVPFFGFLLQMAVWVRSACPLSQTGSHWHKTPKY